MGGDWELLVELNNSTDRASCCSDTNRPCVGLSCCSGRAICEWTSLLVAANGADDKLSSDSCRPRLERNRWLYGKLPLRPNTREANPESCMYPLAWLAEDGTDRRRRGVSTNPRLKFPLSRLAWWLSTAPGKGVAGPLWRMNDDTLLVTCAAGVSSMMLTWWSWDSGLLSSTTSVGGGVGWSGRGLSCCSSRMAAYSWLPSSPLVSSAPRIASSSDSSKPLRDICSRQKHAATSRKPSIRSKWHSHWSKILQMWHMHT